MFQNVFEKFYNDKQLAIAEISFHACISESNSRITLSY